MPRVTFLVSLPAPVTGMSPTQQETEQEDTDESLVFHSGRSSRDRYERLG